MKGAPMKLKKAVKAAKVNPNAKRLTKKEWERVKVALAKVSK
jgi:hypothetical protein